MFQEAAMASSSNPREPKRWRWRIVGNNLKQVACRPTPRMPKAVPSKRKRVVLTLKQKMEICHRLEQGESRVVLMEEFNIGSSTIYDIKSKSQRIKEFYVRSLNDNSAEKRHTLHTPKMEALDRALYEWVLLKKTDGGCVSGPMLQEKARELHEKMSIEGRCSFSSGWLTRFKTRHGIHKLDSSEKHKLADSETVASFRDVFCEPVAKNGLTPEQIYRTHTPKTKDSIEAVSDCRKTNVAEKEESNDDECEAGKVSWQRAIAAFETVIDFVEQQPFFTSQHVMQLHIMQNLTLQEMCSESKEAVMRSFFKKDTPEFASRAPSTDVDPKPSSSVFPDPVPATSSSNPDAKSPQ